MAHGPDTSPGTTGELRPGSRRGVEGRFHVAQDPTGYWSLFDPEGRPFLLRGVAGVCSAPGDSDAEPPSDAAVRLRRWGFNALGPGGDGGARDDGLPFIADAELGAGRPWIIAPGVRLPDVFAPDWSEAAPARALVTCAPLMATPECVGWIGDDGLAWGGGAGERPGLLQVCLSLEPGFAAYHAAWEFLLALHRGSLAAVARAWGVPLPNKEVVREQTRAETAVNTRGYWRDDARWTREFAGRYFSVAANAVRAAAPGQLFFGARSEGSVPPAVLAAAAYPIVDALLLAWTELPAATTTLGPIIADRVGWSAAAFLGADASGSGRGSRLTSLERRLRRARMYLQRLARHPAVVGYLWRQWLDDPGDHPPFGAGLVHLDGREARENTELIADFNHRAETLRRTARKRLHS